MTNDPPDPSDSVSPAVLLWLGALVCALVYLALEPLLAYPVFGSDSGEYYRLTAALLTTGHVPFGSAYLGWGFAYQDFPGLFVLTAATAASTGSGVYAAFVVVVPVVAVLSVVPLFLLFRRLFAHDTIALFAAALASVAFPRLFSLAHPAPLSLGDFLVVGALWMFVEGRRDIRWYLPLGITGAALIATHHLSSYFLLVSALGGLVLVELWRPRAWSRRFPLRELLFLGVFVTGLFLYWFYYATSFGPVLGSGFAGLRPSFALFEGAALAGLLLVGLLLVWRRRRRSSPRGWVRPASDRTVGRDAAFIAILIAIGAGILLVRPLPGTSQTTSGATLLYYSPLFALGVLSAGARRFFSAGRLGPFALTWMAALGLSALAAIATASAAAPASRHVEYLVIPLALLAAVGVGRLAGRSHDRAGRRGLAAVATGAIVLLAANAVVAYPPQALLSGFEEGLTNGDLALTGWVGLAAPSSAVLASDHRLSSLVFGLDGNRATWDSTPELFTGTNLSLALAELNASFAPHTCLPVDFVAVDGVMREGVALDPSAPARPMTSAALAWLSAPPFVLLYENGNDRVYWVDVPVSAPNGFPGTGAGCAASSAA